MEKMNNIIIIGVDLSSNGGIASVVKSYYSAFLKGKFDFNLILLKTNFYKDKSRLHEFFIFFGALFKLLYFFMVKRVPLLHIHSSSKVSFFRKSIFVFLGRLFNKKIIFHLHSSDFYNFFLTDTKWLKKYICFVFSLSNEVIVLCADWEQKLKAHYPNVSIKRIANPIDLPSDIQLKKVVKNPITVIFVGFLIESKGVSDLIEVVRKLKANNIKNVRIKVAGKGELERFLVECIEKEKLGQYIQYSGWISGNKKKGFYRNADIFVLPSYKEGMPISILEAMSFRLPILSTKIAGIPDVVHEGRNGFLFTPGDIEHFYKLLLEMLQEPEELIRIGNNNGIDVMKYSSENIFKEVVSRYKVYYG